MYLKARNEWNKWPKMKIALASLGLDSFQMLMRFLLIHRNAGFHYHKCTDVVFCQYRPLLDGFSPLIKPSEGSRWFRLGFTSQIRCARDKAIKYAALLSHPYWLICKRINNYYSGLPRLNNFLF